MNNHMPICATKNRYALVKLPLLAIILSNIAGCGISSLEESLERRTYMLGCAGDACAEQAKDLCGRRGYEILDRNQGDDVPGMTIRCKA